VIGRVPAVEGFYLNCGWSGHGFKHSPVMGELMAEYVLDGKSQLVDLDFFRPTRFAEGKPIVAKYTYKSVFGYY
jgi:sarcosine oxidase subunit beta